jgi:hypothetical protein
MRGDNGGLITYISSYTAKEISIPVNTGLYKIFEEIQLPQCKYIGLYIYSNKEKRTVQDVYLSFI